MIASSVTHRVGVQKRGVVLRAVPHRPTVLRPRALSRVDPHVNGDHPIPLPLLFLDKVKVGVLCGRVREAG